MEISHRHGDRGSGNRKSVLKVENSKQNSRETMRDRQRKEVKTEI